MVRATWAQRWQDPSLTALLVIEALFIFVGAPLASLGIPLPSIFGAVLICALILTTVMLSGSVSAIALVLASLVLGIAGAAIRIRKPSVATEVLGHGAGIVALAAVSFVVARAVFRPGRVTAHRIRGAVALYLTTALIFSAAYRLVMELAPAAFLNVPGGQSEVGAISTMLYFSFTTLTSTGFGDIVPVNPIARSLANLESIFGQLYPATLLASLVTLQLQDRRR